VKSIVKILIAGLVIIMLGVVLLFWPKNSQKLGVNTSVPDCKNHTYVIENQPVILVNGNAQTQAAPGSASKITTRYFGNEAYGDLNNDGVQDVAFLLTQQGGGSGVFYYVAIVLAGTGSTPTNTIFLGDRIAPQTTQISKGVITVNYADRKPNNPFTTQPSVGVSRYFVVKNGILKEQAMLGNGVTLQIAKPVTFTDGLTVTLEKINNSRCKQGVVCVWAGELAPALAISGGDVGNSSQEVILSTINKPKVTKGGVIRLN
jgi:hypothetical protein